MALAIEIIEDAFREASLTNELQSPTPAQTTKALTMLQRIIAEVYSTDAGEPLVDWREDQTTIQWQYPAINSRIILNLTEAKTIYFPARPYDGTRMQIIDVLGNLATHNVIIDASDNSIEAAQTVTLNTDSANKIWRYDAGAANWVLIAGITANTEMPFGIDTDNYFITRLAIGLSPTYASQVSNVTTATMNKTLSAMRAKTRQIKEMRSEEGLLRLPSNRRFWYGFDDPSRFYRGR